MTKSVEKYAKYFCLDKHVLLIHRKTKIPFLHVKFDEHLLWQPQPSNQKQLYMPSSKFSTVTWISLSFPSPTAILSCSTAAAVHGGRPPKPMLLSSGHSQLLGWAGPQAALEVPPLGDLLSDSLLITTFFQRHKNSLNSPAPADRMFSAFRCHSPSKIQSWSWENK